MSSKKIIIVGPAYPYRGGQALVEAYLHNMLTNQGFETSTVSYSLLYPSLLFPGTTQYDASSFIPFEHKDKIVRIINSINPLSWIKAYKYIKHQKPDSVIFVWWMPFFGPALGYIARQISKYMAQTKIIFLVENYISHESRWFDKYFTKHTLKYADFFISESTHITEKLHENFPNKKVYQTTLSVYDCYDLKNYTKEKAREELNITASNVILFFGMIRPYKGLDKLIETFAQMDTSDTVLMIVGESYEDIDKYKRQIEKYHLQDKIILINKFIPNENIEVYFKAADVVVLPYNSGTQSGILMMAYGFGVPVVATDVGGLTELMVDNKTGKIVKNNQVENLKPAIEFILNSKNDICYSEEIEKLTHKLGYSNLEKMFEEEL